MKILFIGHSASRTGAPISLLRIIRWLKQEKEVIPNILLAQGGELVPEYEKLGKTYVCQNTCYSTQSIDLRLRAFMRRWLNKKLRLHLNNLLMLELKKVYHRANFDAIFCNTSTNGRLLESLIFLNTPIVTRISEMETVIRQYDIEHQFDIVKKYTKLFIAVSESVKNDLINSFNIDSNKIKVIHGAIEPIQEIPKINLRQNLGLPSNIFIVGGSGTDLIRKGFDSFIHLAHTLNNQSNLVFVWLGAERNFNFNLFLSDIKKMNLTDRFFILNQQSNPLSYYQEFDVFMLLSREDPFPLVALENGMLSNPILAFSQSGGVEELLYNTNMLVPYFDFSALSKKIINYSANPELLMNDGNLLKNRVMSHYTIAQSGEKFYKAITSLL